MTEDQKFFLFKSKFLTYFLLWSYSSCEYKEINEVQVFKVHKQSQVEFAYTI